MLFFFIVVDCRILIMRGVVLLLLIAVLAVQGVCEFLSFDQTNKQGPAFFFFFSGEVAHPPGRNFLPSVVAENKRAAGGSKAARSLALVADAAGTCSRPGGCTSTCRFLAFIIITLLPRMFTTRCERFFGAETKSTKAGRKFWGWWF